MKNQANLDYFNIIMENSQGQEQGQGRGQRRDQGQGQNQNQRYGRGQDQGQGQGQGQGQRQGQGQEKNQSQSYSQGQDQDQDQSQNHGQRQGQGQLGRKKSLKQSGLPKSPKNLLKQVLFNESPERIENQLTDRQESKPLPRLTNSESYGKLFSDRVGDDSGTESDASSTKRDDEEGSFKAFRSFWNKEDSYSEEEKKALLFEPANVNFFQLNSEAPILVTMNSNNKIIEKNKLLFPSTEQSEQNDSARDTAILAKFGMKNQVIQPKYMREKGTMCFTDLWGDKQKNSYFASMKKQLRKIRIHEEENSQWDSVYRPQRIRDHKTIQQKRTAQFGSDSKGSPKLKAEEGTKSSPHMESGRKQSVYLSTESSRSRLAETFKDMNMSLLMRRIEGNVMQSINKLSPRHNQGEGTGVEGFDLAEMGENSENTSDSEDPR